MTHFDLVVIGSGIGATLIDERFAGLRVAVIDPSDGRRAARFTGSLATRMLSYPADVVREAEAARRLGVQFKATHVDWAALRDRTIARVEDVMTVAAVGWPPEVQVTMFRGKATFTGPTSVQVGESTITGSAFVIATGSHPRIPDLPGLDRPEVAGRVHTSESMLDLENLPASLVIIGAGVVAVEFAHIFSALGTDVTLLSRSDGVLRREDELVSERFATHLIDQVTVRLGQNVVGIEPAARGRVLVATSDVNGIDYAFLGEQVLFATGRVPNSELNLAAAGVQVDAAGYVIVDSHQQTTAPGIYAVGDVCSRLQLHHVAEHHVDVVRHNLLNPEDRVRCEHTAIPRAVFASPQIASIGATEQDLRASGRPYVASVREFSQTVWGVAMADRGHFVKVLADPATQRLLGAHIMGPHAALLLQPLVQAMATDQTIPTLIGGQYWIYPALSDVVRDALAGLAI